ncbi:MAG TPA: O-antigen ligase family protein, partial [Promineifilum sp.]|nr:O-antigen ligase family protein [Promineifilum sp.]
FFDRLPGPASAGSRMQLAQDAFDLTGDYWLTGAGLNSFDGLYSQYIQVIPFHAVIHSHNLFLNIIIEEGILGIASIGAILALSFWWLSDPKLSGYRRSIHGFSLLAGATFAMLVVLCLHGLVDDVLFGSRGILLLWFPAGITAMLFPRRQGLREWVKAAESPRLIFLGVVTVITALLLVTFRSSLLSSWYATLGAIEMDRVELANYPSGEWSDGSEAVDLGVAVSQFNRALLYDQDNRTAWHRLGLVAMLDRDFETAADSLYHAYLLDSQHRGIRKSLAYARLWAGDLEQAMPLLQEVPDVELELANYVEWWKSQGRPDLSERAEAARNILTNLNSH